MRLGSRTDTAVLACVNGVADPAPSRLVSSARDGHLIDVLDMARHHQVTGYIHRALRRAGSGPGGNVTSAWLRRAEATAAMQQLRAMADLRWVGETLTAAGVPWFLIKGPVLAERVYPEPSLRPSRDLDVVVPAEGFADAIDVLDASGARLLDANWDLAIKDRRSQVHVRLPLGTTMDLHWHLINSGRVRDGLNISMRAVWRGLRTVHLRHLQVDTLAVTETVVHLGLHAALGGAWRLRWLNDLKLVAAHETVDWASVIARARQWRASRLLGVALMRSAQLLGADVPDDLLADLMGSRLYRGTAVLDRMWSPVRATAASAPAQLWPQLVRDSWPDALRAVTWRMQRRAGNGLRGFSYGRQRPQMMTPSGGHRGRERYLRLVERGELDGIRSASTIRAGGVTAAGVTAASTRR